jgi:hypothetical protein
MRCQGGNFPGSALFRGPDSKVFYYLKNGFTSFMSKVMLESFNNIKNI